MSEVDLRVVAFALAALATIWPTRYSTRIVLAAASGALIVASAWSATFESRELDWAVVAVIVIAAGSAWAVPVLFHSFTSPVYTWVLFAGCLGAIHVCVPENDQTTEIGLLLACAGVAEFLMRRRLPAPVWSAAVAGLVWTAVFGATGETRAVIGGLFALVPILATAFFIRPRRAGRPLTETRRWSIALVWLGAAWIVARTGGVAETGAAALLSVGLALLVGVPLSLVMRGNRIWSAP
ncbi:MAG: hypothetical protein ACO3SP_05565 [Ilumatobacteraceae bacterium]